MLSRYEFPNNLLKRYIIKADFRCGNIQLFMGLYLSASKTSKRAITVLNQLGFCISYLSVCKAWESCADRSSRKLRAIVQAGAPFAFMYDNLKVQEESLTNKNEMLNLTACACFLLDTKGINLTTDRRQPSVQDKMYWMKTTTK